ncbi:hypothetical protein SAMN05421690_10164 [Nitrosomonas sp. Nm51]|uniref:polysaccharide lyase n=1 Tax=Nitrosomonas sp. Nm51 TaxID=133720 RepID=UPI0008D20669|nr:hypothetical protein [Nitrosomonas sp. Nm51]SER27430.1 hypothetical protein SAMN05421690_10164 [Nitrosomonas sp. Nm51]
MFHFIITVYLLLLSFNTLGNVYWSQGSEAIRDGATFIYADGSAKLLWRRELGDWIDRHGEPYGKAAFSTTLIEDIDAARLVSLDATLLVKYWLDKPDSYHGAYLKEESGRGTVVFNASETGHTAAPFLAIYTSDNEVKTFEVVSDATLSTTTHQSLGHQTQFQVTSNAAALLAFNEQFLELDSTRITKASLYLTTTDKQFGDVRIGVYAVAPMVAAGEIERGIAWHYPGDRNLADHPDVILAETFDKSRSFLALNTGWQESLSDLGHHDTFQLVNGDYSANRYEPLDGSALQIAFNPKTNFGFTGHYRFQQLIGREPEQMFFRYYLRFGNNWRPNETGKMPGFSGTYNKAGWGGRAIDGYNGWSARGAYFLQASPNSKYSGAIPLGNYVYHLDSQSNYGDMISWNNTLSLLQKNRWYAVEQFLKLNDPDMANGELTVWIDGRKVFHKSDFRFRETTELKIESLWLNFFHGGTAKPASTYFVYIDNLVIASQYIGPMRMRGQE